MKKFAELLDRLSYTPSRNGKLTLLQDYFRTTADPDRGFALAAFTDKLPLRVPLRKIITILSETRFDPVLYRLSRDYVGDSAETLALIWESPGKSASPAGLTAIVESLRHATTNPMAAQIAEWLDQLTSGERWALLKFLSGALRVGVSARLAKYSLALAFSKDLSEIEELWHGQIPPYIELFDWLMGIGERPLNSHIPTFKPLMLANPLEEDDWEKLLLHDYAFEWKWDGIRVQLVGRGEETALFSRNGDEIGKSFPELLSLQNFNAVLDGELLIKGEREVQSFSDLQQRLNRKTVTSAIQKTYPAHIRLYDALEIEGIDLRSLPFEERRTRLEHWHKVSEVRNTDLSPLINVESKVELREMWKNARVSGVEGLMIKLKKSPYLAGRPQGKWFKWKRDALVADCVLMYAQRGSGKRSSYYSDYTFGAWTQVNDVRVLVPVGKAYSGFTDAELLKIDRFIRENTVQQFGPVRAVSPALVFEVAFDSINRSKRHKSGIAMRFPRISRIRWDKLASEADSVITLLNLAE